MYERTALGLIKFLSGKRATQVEISRFLFKSLEKSWKRTSLRGKTQFVYLNPQKKEGTQKKENLHRMPLLCPAKGMSLGKGQVHLRTGAAAVDK